MYSCQNQFGRMYKWHYRVLKEVSGKVNVTNNCTCNVIILFYSMNYHKQFVVITFYVFNNHYTDTSCQIYLHWLRALTFYLFQDN